MELYLIIVILLFALAISDLIVGVSNDAVNFLNSALGSRVASRRTILIVVSVGIALGATFASGMMEVARKGIFNPQFFSFSEVMIIFLAVMLTDIILLDLFNTFALPTSTTVSIVFELLGASVAMAAIKVSAQGEAWSAISTYINSSSALAIISGIFISVGIAFTIGALVQYLTRFLLTFKVERQGGLAGIIWSGVALAAIGYFLLIKGLKGASFVGADFQQWVAENTLLLLAFSFVATTALALILHYRKINTLRIVVLAGTFALAMAFAGNDLVNFIGVPLAGFESYFVWSASGQAADELMMDSLAAAYPPRTYMLLLAGGIMVTTLWLSKKARSVTETEINLGRQAEGLERFSSNRLSRFIVRFFFGLSKRSNGYLPIEWRKTVEDSFDPPPRDPRAPAFDLVRASVNLTVASILIAIATSYRLPLSTTYVSFMVAMGTSLADRAWGRDSAVYRVAGVLNVIGGWFMTAFIAFGMAALFALLIHRFGPWMIALLVAAAVLFIYNTFRYHRQKSKDKERVERAHQQYQRQEAQDLIQDTASQVATNLRTVQGTYTNALRGLLQEDEALLSLSLRKMEKLRQQNEEFQYIFHGTIRRLVEQYAKASRTYLLAYDLEQDLIQSAELIVRACHDYVADILPPLTEEQGERLRALEAAISPYLVHCATVTNQRERGVLRPLKKEKTQLLQQIEPLLTEQVEGIKTQRYGARNSMLYFSLLLETKDMVAVAARLAKLYYRLEHKISEEEPLGLIVGKEAED
jgi:phosphate/sulfate permease